MNCATLSMPNNQIEVEAIVANAWIRTLVHERAVASTNTLAGQLVASGVCELPLLVLADEQTAGRGRGSNQWWSREGSITLSLAVSRAELTIVPQSIYSLAVAVAVHNALATTVETGRLALKWPNDVMLDGRKVAGILLESAGPAASVLVVGIGLNANNDFRDAPVDVRLRAISAAAACGRPIDATKFACRLVSCLQSVFTSRDTAADVLAQYRAADFLAGKRIRVCREGESWVGECIAVDDAGSLVLATASGSISLASGTVEIDPN